MDCIESIPEQLYGIEHERPESAKKAGDGVYG